MLFFKTSERSGREVTILHESLVWLLLMPLAFALLFFTANAKAQTGVAHNNCLNCHDSQVTGVPEIVPMFQETSHAISPSFPETSGSPNSTSARCVSCHDTASTAQKLIRSSSTSETNSFSDLCLGAAPCHSGKSDAVASRHDFSADASITPSEKGICFGCHTPHPESSALVNKLWVRSLSEEISTFTQTDSPNYLTGNTILCYDCHSGTAADNSPTLPAAEDIAFDGSLTGYYETDGGHKIISSGSTGIEQGDKLACADCHDLHDAASNEAFIKSDLGGKSTVGLKASANARNGTGNGRAICNTCHGYGDGSTSPSVSLSDVNPLYGGITQIVRKPSNIPDHNDSSSKACTDCHKHNNLAHGGGSGCQNCHGHTPGYVFYDPITDSTITSLGTGTTKSHSTHTQDDAAHIKGPNVGCDDCHDINDFPNFKSGTDSSGDGKIALNETNVCDNCHSPGGGYNGVDTTSGSIGAKNNWSTGVYETTDTLQSGKEAWCVGCHDSDPAQINAPATGDITITAPDIGGDASSYGFYLSGHGLTETAQYDKDSIGGGAGNDGAGKECIICHDQASEHLDGVDSTTAAGQRVLNTINGTGTATPFDACLACHQKSTGGDAAVKQVSTHGNDTAEGYTPAEEPYSIECQVCHDPHGKNKNANGLRNLKMVKSSINATDIVFENTSGTKSFDSSDAPASQSICVTCHQTSANNPGYPMANHAGGDHGVGIDDQRGTDCIGCHSHDYLSDGTVTPSDAFMPSCNGCHTYPAGGSQGTYQGSITHDAHVVAYGFDCKKCHYTFPLNHNEGGVTSKDDWAAKFDPADVDVVFDPSWNASGSTTIAISGLNRNRQCENLYCHGQAGYVNGVPFSALGGLNQSSGIPIWDDAYNPDAGYRYDVTKLTGDCGTCHDTTKDNQGQSGSLWPTWNTTDEVNIWTTTQTKVWDVTPGTSIGEDASETAHATHLDRLKGPKIACNGCHATPPEVEGSEDTETPLNHVNQNVDFKGGTTKASTTACNECHSPGGSYDGVDDTTIGAKPNWTAGVYDDESSPTVLAAGKDRWCAGCHDEAAAPSVIVDATAPAVAGDESSTTPYGTGYGFYKTGHGLPSSQAYPWTENMGDPQERSGAGLFCSDCHNLSKEHIDGVPRTYSSSVSPAGYKNGYRLSLVNGYLPMAIPRTDANPGVDTDDFRLCLKCHVDLYGPNDPYTSDNLSSKTNFKNAVTPRNAHNLHLSFSLGTNGPVFQSDWGAGSGDSRPTCPQCHNVHGSTRLSMVNDGRLVDREPGLKLSYVNSSNGSDSAPNDVVLGDSTGTAWDAGSWAGSGLCASGSGCHSGPGGYTDTYLRDPYDDVAPEIIEVFGQIGSNTITVKFSEPVWGPSYLGYDLDFSCFSITDNDNGRGITNVIFDPGKTTALLALSSSLDATDDVGTDTIGAAPTAIFDTAGNEMDFMQATTILDADITAPSISNRSPGNGATGVDTNSDLTFTLTDDESGIDWSTFSINIVGSKGYSKTYTDADSSTIVSKVGDLAAYGVTINPDSDFSTLEDITATVSVDDYRGNTISPPSWSFETSTSAAPMTITLHPSGFNSSNVSWSVAGGTWATVLDTSDTGSIAYCNTNTGDYFYADMDDTNTVPISGGATVQNIRIYARAKNGGGVSGQADIGYRTGTATVWQTGNSLNTSTYTLIGGATAYTNNSDSTGTLTMADIDNLTLAVRRTNSSGLLMVTELFVEVTYIP